MGLEDRLKQRLLGGAVLVALVVIFVPMLIEEPVERRTLSDHTIPAKPAVKQTVPEMRIQSQRDIEPKSVQTETKPDPKETLKPERVVTKPETVATKKVKAPESKPTETAKEASNRPSPSAWMIQVASLTNEQNAKKLVEDLRNADLPAQMEKVRLNGKLHYRVRVGPEVDHRLAEKMLAKIKQAFKLNPTLMRYPDSQD
jgi:DedD protein